jgi:hypothetical protein
LEDLNLTLNLLFLDWLQNLNNAFGIVDDIDTLKHLEEFIIVKGEAQKQGCKDEVSNG